MTQTESGRWHLNGVTPEELLLRLPGMGRLTVIFRENGVTQERNGLVNTGSVSDWQKDGGETCAPDETGLPTGLAIRRVGVSR